MEDKLVEGIKDKAREIAEQEECEPMVFAITGDSLAMIPIGNVPKDLFKPIMQAVLHRLKATAYVMVHEVWGAQLSKDSPWMKKVLSGEMKVSELPPDDVAEELMVWYVGKGGEFRSWHAKIRGNREIGKWEEIPFKPEGGRMVLLEW